MSTMNLMSGPSAAGKTTFAKKFASEHPEVRYLCIDDFYAVHGGSETSHIHEFEVWMAFFNAIHLAERDGVDVMIDTNAPTRVMRTQFLDWFGDFDRYELFFIDATFESCVTRNMRRDRVVPEDHLQHMYRQVERPYILEDSRWDEIHIYENSDNRFSIRETPLIGPGFIKYTNTLTLMLDTDRKPVACHDETYILIDPRKSDLIIVCGTTPVGVMRVDQETGNIAADSACGLFLDAAMEMYNDPWYCLSQAYRTNTNFDTIWRDARLAKLMRAVHDNEPIHWVEQM